MMLLIASGAAAVAAPAPTRVQASASVRIERPATASREQWERAAKGLRREIVIRDEDGQWVLLRLVEQQ